MPVVGKVLVLMSLVYGQSRGERGLGRGKLADGGPDGRGKRQLGRALVRGGVGGGPGQVAKGLLRARRRGERQEQGDGLEACAARGFDGGQLRGRRWDGAALIEQISLSARWFDRRLGDRETSFPIRRAASGPRDARDALRARGVRGGGTRGARASRFGACFRSGRGGRLARAGRYPNDATFGRKGGGAERRRVGGAEKACARVFAARVQLSACNSSRLKSRM